MPFSNHSLFSLTSLQTKEKLSQIDCEPTTETVDCGRNPPGLLDSGIAEVHRQKKLAMGGSSMKAQRSKSTPSKPISKSSPERKPTVESVEKSALLETGRNGQNATMTVKLSQNKHSNDDAFKDQSKHDSCFQKASKSKLPKRSTSGDDVVVTARENVLTDERVACKAQKQTSTKESSKSEAKGRQPLSKDRAPIKIPDKVDKKYIKGKKDNFISNISGTGKQQETCVKTAQSVEKYPKNKDIKVSDHEESKASLASKNPNTPCRAEKTSDITTINETDGPKTTQRQDSEQRKIPKIETSLQVPKSPKTGKLMFALKWPLWLKIIEMFFLYVKINLWSENI